MDSIRIDVPFAFESSGIDVNDGEPAGDRRNSRDDRKEEDFIGVTGGVRTGCGVGDDGYLYGVEEATGEGAGDEDV